MCCARARATTLDTEPASLTETPAPEQRHLVLIDGSGFIFRAFHALPPMTRADGTPVNAVFGFANMLAKMLREHVGTHFAVIFDAGRTTFRNRMYDAYKAHRPEPPPELIPQFALVRDATAAFGVPAIELADWEADDLIASYVRAACEAGWRSTIVSSDKDLMQLVREGVGMLDPIKNKPIGRAEVIEKFGVPPEKLVEVQALMGDSVDNVPGVPGIGPKGAAQLVLEHGDLEGVLAAAPAMKPSKKRELLITHAEAARLSRRLVVLADEAPLPLPLEDLGAREPDGPTLSAWLAAMGFRSIVTRLGLTKADAPVPSPSAPTEAPPAPTLPDAPFGPYVCVTTIAELTEWVAEAVAAGLVAMDTETNGLDPMRANLVGFSMATKPGRACYVPLRHELLDPQIPVAAAIEALGPLMMDPSVLKVFHNAKFDIALLTGAGAAHPAPCDDTMLISFAQDAGRHGHGLDELSMLHLGYRPIPYDEVTGTGRARVSVFASAAGPGHRLRRRGFRCGAAAVARVAATPAPGPRAGAL